MAKIAEAYVELFARMDRLKKGMARAGNLVRKGMAKMTVAVKAFAAATRTAMPQARLALLAFAGAVAGVLYLTAQQEKAEAKKRATEAKKAAAEAKKAAAESAAPEADSAGAGDA